MTVNTKAPRSLWASVTPPGAAFPSLEADHKADVVVIGAGFTGLSSALHLAEAGCGVVVLDAAEPGWGASGRNNGQVIPTLSRRNPDDIVHKHGEAGERFVGLVRDSATDLFELVRRHGIDAEAEQTGWVQPAHAPSRLRLSEERARQWAKWGAPVAFHDREAIRTVTGSDAWFGGFSNPTGGHINPLALARGLARVAAAKGVRIFAHSAVAAIERRANSWLARTDRGVVAADALVLATNAYSDEFKPRLAPSVAREIVPVLSWQSATRPLEPTIGARILPGRWAMSDTHGDLHFARPDARGRLVSGGALIFPQFGVERLKRRIGARLRRLWPQIGQPEIDFVWNGAIAMTVDYFPRFHRLGPSAYAFAGCNGRGVALSLAVGREFAKAIQGAGDKDLALPFSEPTPLPAHALLRRLGPLKLIEYRLRDRL
jgi:glycine/D-amino acid oxidase-like deaminating enzyme